MTELLTLKIKGIVCTPDREKTRKTIDELIGRGAGVIPVKIEFEGGNRPERPSISIENLDVDLCGYVIRQLRRAFRELGFRNPTISAQFAPEHEESSMERKMSL